jgi:predicted nucleic acid-binding protein
MSRVFWDTNLFIYLLEDYGDLSKLVASLRSRMLERGDQLFTSALTLGEVLIKPTEKGDERLKRSYWDVLTQVATLIPFDGEAALHYVAIRKDRGVKAPDAIQLACAAQAQIDLFITNDDRLKGRIVAGVQFIVPLKNALI